MVGKRPRNYTSISRLKLGAVLMQRIIARNPNLDPAIAAQMANEMVNKHAYKQEKASEIYHMLKPWVMEELGIRGQDLAKVRALVQYVVMNILREYESMSKPIDATALRGIIDTAREKAVTMLRISQDNADRLIRQILTYMQQYIAEGAIEEAEREAAAGAGGGGG